MAKACELQPVLKGRVESLCAYFDQGKGPSVDQAMLVQIESVIAELNGHDGTISSSSGSVNTSLDDWSDDSDEDIDWEVASAEALVAEAWLREEFKML